MIELTARRLVRVGVSYELLIEMMYEDYEINHGIRCISGIPVGAEYIDSYYDYDSRTAYIIFSHESFELVLQEQTIPLIHIEHQCLYPELKTD